MTTLQTLWFLLVGILLAGYAILDGMDLGAGFWHLFTRKDGDRRTILNSIGPFWDGNEVWLLTGGGALFAAFPPVYATVFSGFYLALMLLLVALISRAVSIEFRSKVEDPTWRKVWDTAFSLGSIVAGLLLGVALGNIMRGIPLDAAGNYTGSFFGLLNPFSLVVGLTGLAMLAVHGAVYIALKAPGDLSATAAGWGKKTSYVYIALYIVASIWSVAANAHLRENFSSLPVLWLLPVLALASMVAIPILLAKGSLFKALLASSAAIALNFATVGAGLFPRLVPSLGDPALTLTAANSSSTEKTLLVMLIVALIGMPIVLVYTIYSYRTFKGKVVPEEHVY
jgi:cytochrome d ubiquinol oxidase subunit II